MAAPSSSSSSSSSTSSSSSPPSVHARCDAFWQWPSFDERRLWSPSPRFRPFASTRANALALLAARAVLLAFAGAATIQSTFFFTVRESSEHFIAFMSNQGEWLVVVALFTQLVLTAAAVARVEWRSDAIGALLMPAAADDADAPAVPAAPSLAALFVLGWKRAALVLVEIAVVYDSVVVLLFWLLLRQYVQAGDLSYWHALSTHGVMLAILALDLGVLGAARLVPRHVLTVIGAGFAYAAINGCYVAIRGAPLYPFLTWKSEASAVVVLGVLVLLIALWFAIALVPVARDSGCGCGCCGGGGGGVSASGAAKEGGGGGGAVGGGAVGGSARSAEEEARWRAVFPLAFDDEAAAARVCGCCPSSAACWACCTNVDSPRRPGGAGAGAGGAPLLGP